MPSPLAPRNFEKSGVCGADGLSSSWLPRHRARRFPPRRGRHSLFSRSQSFAGSQSRRQRPGHHDRLGRVELHATDRHDRVRGGSAKRADKRLTESKVPSLDSILNGEDLWRCRVFWSFSISRHCFWIIPTPPPNTPSSKSRKTSPKSSRKTAAFAPLHSHL